MNRGEGRLRSRGRRGRTRTGTKCKLFLCQFFMDIFLQTASSIQLNPHSLIAVEDIHCMRGCYEGKHNENVMEEGKKSKALQLCVALPC